MKTLIIATLIFLDIIPQGVPFVSDSEKNLESKVAVQESQHVNDNPPLIDFSPLPFKNDKFYMPIVGARNYEAVDMGTGEILLEKGSDESVMVASLTKLMTARLLLKSGDLDKIVTVKDLNKMRADDSRMWLAVGDKVTYRTLLHGLLINSGSDAALTIANTLYSGGYDEFITKMNEEAKSMGLENTHFDNPVGWDSPKNYSSAGDLQILARVLFRDEDFRKIVSTKSEIVYSENGRPYRLKNTNVLLNGKTVFGVKTGHTLSAGDCLIAHTKVKERDVLFVILGAKDRFTETRNLLKWTEIVYNW